MRPEAVSAFQELTFARATGKSCFKKNTNIFSVSFHLFTSEALVQALCIKARLRF